MAIRDEIEQHEEAWLAAGGSRSRDARRSKDDVPSAIRTAYQRDRDRIIHCKAFRRLKFKTQVFLSPDGDHYRTRLTHTLEVTQIARTIARALHLNEDLAEAIGLGHDLGHTPFGHVGERSLASVYPHFRHNEQSLRVVDLLENDGRGLNLTEQTRDGILRHSKPDRSIEGEVAGTPLTAEAQVVKISDSIAYMNHDFDDAVRNGILTDRDLPDLVRSTLGERHSRRIDTLVNDVVEESAPLVETPVEGGQVIHMSPPILEAANQFREMLFEKVYRPVNDMPATRMAGNIVIQLFEHFVQFPELIPEQRPATEQPDPVERRAADAVAGMTDRFALRAHAQLFPSS